MNGVSHYLEEAKIDELVQQLESQGYQVEREVTLPAADTGLGRLDLVARRGKESVVYEVKASDALKSAAAQIAALRTQAREQGYNDFRLVVVRPPRQIEVDKLPDILYEYISEVMPANLVVLSAHTSVAEVADVEVEKISIAREQISISGTGLVGVELEYEGGGAAEGLTLTDSFPFRFSLDLTHDFGIADADIHVDTSSWYG